MREEDTIRVEMTQPLNEAYSNELLEAYQKISDTFNDFTLLMRKRVPYEEWPDHCKIAGISEDLKGEAEESDPLQIKTPLVSSFKEEMRPHFSKCLEDLQESLNTGWYGVQSNCRPDVSFRAMVKIIEKWKESVESMPCDIISRVKDLGRAEEKLHCILKDEMFNDPYFVSKNTYLRDKISQLSENLWDLMGILRDKDK